MVRRGLRVEAEKIGRLVKKQTGKTDGLDATLDEIEKAEYASGTPLEPLTAHLFRRYRSIGDAIGELIAWRPPHGGSKASPPPAASLPRWDFDFRAPYAQGRSEAIRAKLLGLKKKLGKEKHDFETTVTFLRGIHDELKKRTGRRIRWSVIPDAKTVETIHLEHSDSLQRWTTSPPRDLAERLRSLGEVAGLVEAWKSVGELVMLYGKPTEFFEKYAPEITPALFDPDRLDERVGPAKTLSRCLFVWGPSVLLNPVVKAAWDRVIRRRSAFQDVITAMTGRTPYKEGRPSGSGTHEPLEHIRLRGRIVDAIQHLQKDPSEQDPALAGKDIALLKKEGYWLVVAPLVGKRSTSYTDACRIVSTHLGISLEAVKKSCKHPAKDERTSRGSSQT